MVRYHPKVQAVQKKPAAVTHVSSSSQGDIVSPNTDQDTENRLSAEMVAIMEGKPEVSRETCTATIDTTSSSTDAMSSTTDSSLEETLSISLSSLLYIYKRKFLCLSLTPITCLELLTSTFQLLNTINPLSTNFKFITISSCGV